MPGCASTAPRCAAVGPVLGSPRFDDIASAYNFALMIPQRDTERLLAAHLQIVRRRGRARGRAGRLYRGGRPASRPGCGTPTGAKRRSQTPWLIGCDGAHSTVRHGLGVEFSGSAQGDDWLLADVRLEVTGAPPSDEIAIYLHRDGPFVIFPIPGGRARVIATVGKTDPAHPRPDPTLDDVQALRRSARRRRLSRRRIRSG